LRILHAFKVFTPEVWGGVPEVIAYLARGMSPRHQSSVLVARNRGYRRSYLWDDIEVSAMSSLGAVFSTPIAPAFPFALAKRSRGVDLVALHQPFPLNDFGVAVRFPKQTALVLHWHSEILGREPLVKMLKPILRRTIKRADNIIVSDASLIFNSPLLREHSKKCVIIPFGVDVSFWANLETFERDKVEELRQRFPRLIISTGRLVPYKGFDVLIRAMKKVDGVALIVGSGSQRQALAHLARNLGVSDRILLPGSFSRRELRLLLHVARMYVLSSISSAETFSIAQLEAMAVGLPIINTNLPTGVPHVARHGIEGLTVEPNDPEQLESAIAKVLSDEELARRLGAAGRMRATSEYRLQTFVERAEQVYESAFNGRSN
jgi:glycosyltransferase involved in cell wall biosynthesis